ncbi:MAG: hypothetical protein ACI4RA_05905 [Kiritimatiellia bacterium]
MRGKNFTGSVTLTETAAGKTYPVTIDFTKPAPVIGGCDGSGTLVKVPTTGVIAVAFAGDEPVAGEYGLARFTAGGNLLAGWSVTAPTGYKGHSVEVMKDETGLWLKIRKGGMCLVIR